MPANVRSLESIQSVRAALSSFRDDVEQALATIDLEMRRVLEWLEHDRPRFLRIQLRKANDDVTAARAALHRCLMYPINDERPSCYEERAALKQAEARLTYCDEKAERLRHWVREVRHEMFEYEGRIGQLMDLVEIDTPQAMAILDRLLARLDEYQAIRTQTNGDTSASMLVESFAREIIPEQTPLAPAEVAPETAEPPESSAEEAT